MTETTELHKAIAQMQVLMRQAADVIEQNTKRLAESHERDGLITDTEVLASIESDTDLVAHLRAAALPWDQRHKKPEPTDSMGMPVSCGKPLCSPGDHHPLCKLADQPAQQEPVAWKADVQKVRDALGPEDWCGDERMADVLDRALAKKPCCKNMAAGTSCIADPLPNCLLLAAAPKPTQRKPLTDEEISELADRCTPNTETGALNYRVFARAIEDAHGIKE